MIDADIGWWYDLCFFGEVTEHLLFYFIFSKIPLCMAEAFGAISFSGRFDCISSS